MKAPLFLFPEVSFVAGEIWNTAVAEEIERRVGQLGFDLVDIERAGDRRRPILRVYVDKVDSGPGSGVNLDECARISRHLEEHLDAVPELNARYVLEVSSPGIERPLVRRRDWERFTGETISVKGREVLAGSSRRLQGKLAGISGEEGEERVSIELKGGEVVEVPRSDIKEAHLVFEWDRPARRS